MPVPPLSSEDEQSQLTSIAMTAGIILSLFFVGVFILDLLMGYSMAYLWTMIRAL